MLEVVKRLPSSMALSSPVHPEELSIFSETCGPRASSSLSRCGPSAQKTIAFQ
uniref:Uncharacterized protein n=1 Tax=Anguilla anguilla TaxID=7936 RepID=A0A0E9QTA0_ANGAN